MLRALDVRHLVVPSVHARLHLWTDLFGFEPATSAEEGALDGHIVMPCEDNAVLLEKQLAGRALLLFTFFRLSLIRQGCQAIPRYVWMHTMVWQRKFLKVRRIILMVEYSITLEIVTQAQVGGDAAGTAIRLRRFCLCTLSNEQRHVLGALRYLCLATGYLILAAECIYLQAALTQQWELPAPARVGQLGAARRMLQRGVTGRPST